jgi:anaerobic ribonucleoside-triphosphate reductase activating protein
MYKLDPLLINLAAFQPETQALGPGKRVAIWVQGCPFHCKGCIAQDWIPTQPANLITPVDLANIILTIPDLEGITISGGEPMLQAQALNLLLDIIFDKRDLGVICFTGFKVEQLQHSPPNVFVNPFLSNIDLLIDGLYVESLNNGKGLRGSTNQRFHHLTKRYSSINFDNQPRKMEVLINESEAFVIGVPILNFDDIFPKAMDLVA